MKKALSVLLALCMLWSLMLTACVAEETKENDGIIVLTVGSATMKVNGADMPIDEQGTTPVIVRDRVLLLVRAVVEQMGGTVAWNGETEQVTLRCGADEIQLTVSSTEAYFNRQLRTLDVAPVVMNDRTMLPIRWIAECFHFRVDWNEHDQTVTIAKTNPASTEPDRKPNENPPTAGKSLVVYFSATGNTKALAEKIAEVSGADLFELVPEQAYTSADLDYNNSNCRANREQHDSAARPAISGKIENLEAYDTLFIGYPIWWGTMPKIILTFLESYDLSGKTVLPFCTSGGSGIEASVAAMKTACPNAEVKDGFRGTANSGNAQLEEWIQKSLSQ